MNSQSRPRNNCRVLFEMTTRLVVVYHVMDGPFCSALGKMYQILKFFVFVLTEVNPFTDWVNDSSGGS